MYQKFEFDFDSLESDLPADVYRRIDDMFQAWAMLETTLTDWLIDLMGMDDDVGRLIVDRFDTRSKLARIKDIYTHFGNSGSLESVKFVTKNFDRQIEIRNIIAHKIRLGITPDKAYLYFSTGRYEVTSRTEMAFVGVAVEDIQRCTVFASTAAQQIRRALHALKQA